MAIFFLSGEIVREGSPVSPCCRRGIKEIEDSKFICMGCRNEVIDVLHNSTTIYNSIIAGKMLNNDNNIDENEKLIG